MLRLRTDADAPLDPNLIAVAPFDVLDPKLEIWREGLVDVLSRNLDGAGPLRTVSPTVVVRRWSGRADPVSAIALGRRTGARLVAFGQLLPASTDSVRLAATLLDVATRRSIADVEVRDVAARIDRLADSATFALLAEVGRTRPIGAVRLTSLKSTSLPALRAFLQGEQYFRRTRWDSALASYEQAIKLDTTFAPALRRAWRVLAFQEESDYAWNNYALRAGANNHGLSPRDSLLVTADSLWAAQNTSRAGWSWRLVRRLFETLEEATRRYPDDPEAWYSLGEVRYWNGFGRDYAVSSEQVLQTYDRSIALDSGFAPAYIPPVWLALQLRRPIAAQRYIAAYLALAPSGAEAQGLRLVSSLVNLSGRRSPDFQRLLDTVSTDALFKAWLALRWWPDSTEMAVQVARAAATRWHAPHPNRDSMAGPHMLEASLSSRGHLRETWATFRKLADYVGAADFFSDMALFGIIPSDSAAAIFDRWARDGRELFGPTAWWWSTQGDTASLHVFIRRADSLAASIRVSSFGPSVDFWQYVRDGGLAYLALARHDTNEALHRLELLPDTLCPGCGTEVLTTAQLLATRGRYREAAVLLDRRNIEFYSPQYVLWAFERGRVNERLGNREKATEAYTFVVDVWRNADHELQGYVTEARERLRRIGAGPRR